MRSVRTRERGLEHPDRARRDCWRRRRADGIIGRWAESKTSVDAWERNAGQWLAWARTPDHDAYHWRFNFPQFTELLPETASHVLDVGCGEGRVGRWLAARSHTVVGIDSSPTLTEAAREAGGYQEIVCGDAAHLPWPNDTFDLVVAYMSLHDMPDPEPVIGEIARVLRRASSFALAIVHPLNRLDENLDPSAPVRDCPFRQASAVHQRHL